MVVSARNLALVSIGLVLLLGWVTPGLGMSPMADDLVVFDGQYALGLGVWIGDFAVPAGMDVAGIYAGIEGIERFSIRLNGSEVHAATPCSTSRTLLQAIDLSRFAKDLGTGTNRLEVRATRPADSFALRFWLSEEAWYLASLHNHTTYSDGVLPVHDLLSWAERDGADLLAVTDHNTLAHQLDTAFHPIGRLTPMGGVEWTTDSGHANLLGVQGQEDFRYGGPVATMIDDASYRGGLVVVNHPCAPPWAWLRYPELDSGLDAVELMNGRTGFRSGQQDNSQAAIDWWHELLSLGIPVAGVANSDFHNPPEHPLRPCSRIRSRANHPDSIIEAVKHGRVMACDRHDRSRLHVYCDADCDGALDAQTGDRVLLGGVTRPVRFRVEAEEAGPGDLLCLFRRSGRFLEFRLPEGGDFGHEWIEWFGAGDTDFVRAELRRQGGDCHGICTNPIYVNYPPYQLGPVQLETEFTSQPEDRLPWRPETLRFRVVNHAGISPYRFGVALAFDTTRWRVLAWQISGPGVGRVGRPTRVGQHAVLEWQGGYEWGNRLRPGSYFDYWVSVAAKVTGSAQVLFRSWAHDRLQVVAEDPAEGEAGLMGLKWHSEDVQLLQNEDAAGAIRDGEPDSGLPAASMGRELDGLGLAEAGRHSCKLVLYDGTGRRAFSADFPAGVPAGWRLRDAAGSRLTSGVYFLRVRTDSGTATRRFLLLR